jgi:NADH-quinone oxidoreductase subunit C
MRPNYAEMEQKIKESVGFDLNDDNPPVMYVPKSNIVRTLTILHSHTGLKFLHLTDILVVDYSECDPRFEINYLLRSMHDHCQICVRTHVEEDDGLDSVAAVYKSANWREREIGEMFGIPIRDHTNIRRLNANAEGFLLRRDVLEK